MEGNRKEQDGTFVKLMTTGSIAEADQILEILKVNNIEAFKKGGIMDIYAGSSLEGEDIFVPEEKVKEARELVLEFQPIPLNDSADGIKATKGKRALGWVLLVIIVIFGFLLPLFL